MPKDNSESRGLINLSRRQFLGTMGTAGLALAIGFPRFAASAEEAEVKKYGADAMPHGWVDDPLVFLHIATSGVVTIICHRSEMGQGVRTSLPMVVADELGADWNQVVVEQAPGDEVRFGNQDTDGSRSIRHFFQPMRRCGAAARSMLEQAAAEHWGVPVKEVTTGVHLLEHRKSGRSIGFGEVAEAAAKLPVPARDSLALKSPDQFRYIGKGKTANIDGKAIVTGTANYGIDTELEDMHYAVIARPPVYGSTVKSVDDSATRKISGVVDVIRIKGTPPPSEFQPLGGVAVIATNTWAAIKGREALKITWTDSDNQSYDSTDYRDKLTRSVNQPVDSGELSTADKVTPLVRNEGDAYAALEKAARHIKADYYSPHLAQAPMEPPMAAARMSDGHCEVWAATQAPQVTRERVAKRVGLPVEKVKINVTLLGGGFGRKSKPDYVVESAILAKAMQGKPVKMVWTREDDIQHGYYHTVSAEHVEAGLDKNGKAIAWLHRSAAPTIFSIFQPKQVHEAPFERGMGLTNTPFDIANLRLENPAAEAHARIGWFRSVSNIPHAFAIQSFVAELAETAGKDPKDFLLELIGPSRKILPASINDHWNYGESPEKYPLDTGRLRNVVTTVAEKAGWGKQLPEGQGLGIAAHYSFVTYVAAVVHVEISDGELTIPRVDVAADCGARINPERIRSQLEGAVVMGLSNALLSEISFSGGQVEQSNFHDYQVARMNHAPKEIRVHFVDSTDFDAPLGGVGEPCVPTLAPALCNAIYAAVGKRIRQLPIGDQLQG